MAWLTPSEVGTVGGVDRIREDNVEEGLGAVVLNGAAPGHGGLWLTAP